MGLIAGWVAIFGGFVVVGVVLVGLAGVPLVPALAPAAPPLPMAGVPPRPVAPPVLVWRPAVGLSRYRRSTRASIRIWRRDPWMFRDPLAGYQPEILVVPPPGVSEFSCMTV